MPKPKKGARLGSNPKHQRLMLANLAGSLFEHGRIRTTEAKAKLLRPYAEKLITKAKKGDVHNRRLVLSDIQDRDIVHKLFSDIAPRFADRNGGYTRILKLGPRNGDAAPMALIELIDGVAVTRVPAGGDDVEDEGKRRRIPRPRRRSDKPVRSQAAEAAAAGTGDEDIVDAPPDEVEESAEAELAAEEASAEAATDAAEQAQDDTEPAGQQQETVEGPGPQGEKGD